MRREHFDHLIAAAAQVSGEKEIVVIGSQAILGTVDEPPESMVLSMEADIYPHHDPGKAAEIDASLGDGSPFHRTYGYYAHGVGPETPKAPTGWRDRLVGVENGDRAALQALVPLAGALGVGTIFVLFFGGRRKSGIAVFERFAIVAVLTAAGSTAYFSVSLLHQNEVITSHELTQTATPLVVAAFLLVFVSVFARLPGSLTRIVTLLPLAIAGIVIAALLAGSTWSAGPENAGLVALAMLAVGALVGVAAWLIDRLDIRLGGSGGAAALGAALRGGLCPGRESPSLRLAPVGLRPNRRRTGLLGEEGQVLPRSARLVAPAR